MAEKLGLEVGVTANTTGLKSGMADVRKELTQTAISAQKTDSSVVKLGSVLNNAGGIAQKAAGQIGGLASSLLSGGLITGVTLAGVALFELGKKLFDVTEEQKNLNEVLEGAKSAYVKATIDVNNLREAFGQAENGIIHKEQALKLYNDTLGKTLGKTKDYDEAERSFIANASNYIKFTLLKAAANIALGKAAEAAFEVERNTLQGATKEGFLGLQNLASVLSGGPGLSDEYRAILRIAEATKQENEFKKIANSLTDQANSLGFTQVALDEKVIKVKKEKINVLKEEKVELDKRTNLLPQSEDKTLSLGTGSTITPTIVVKPLITFDNNALDLALQSWIENDLKERLLNMQVLAAEAINQTISNILNDTISSLADGIAGALSGDADAFEGMFDNIIKGIGGQIKELGKYLVKVGVEMLITKKAVESLGLSPQGAIIAGFALQILGSLLTAAATKKTKQVGFATGVRNFEGGVALVGERGPELVNLPRGSGVIPNNETMAYGGGGSHVFIPAVTLSGIDLVIAFNRASQQMGRNN